MLTKQNTLLGRGAWAESSRGKGAQENCSATWLAVSGFMVMGLVSGLSLANHLAWPVFGLIWSFLVHEHLSSKMDSSVKDSGRLAGHIMGWRLRPLVAPPESSQLVFGGGSIMVLIRPPAVTQVMHVVIIVPGQGSGFFQQFPNRIR